MSNVDQPHRDTNDGDDLEVEWGGREGGRERGAEGERISQ